MSTQARLDFEPEKLARATDPETSHAAAAACRELRDRHHGLILDALLEGPRTSEELSLVMPLEYWQITRRMGELRDGGYVKDTGLRHKTSKGRKAIVWALADEPGGDK